MSFRRICRSTNRLYLTFGVKCAIMVESMGHLCCTGVTVVLLLDLL